MRKLRMNGLMAPVVSLALGFSIVMGAASAQDVDPDKVLAKVGSVEITQADVDVARNELGSQFARVPPAQRDTAILNTLIDFQVIAQKAEGEGFADNELFKNTIELARIRALHDTYFRQTTVEKLDPAEVEAAYNEQMEPLQGQTEIRARHILLETEEAAKEVIEMINAGGDFEELAKEKSTGPSGPSGGDLGFFGKGRMVPQFEEAAFALEAGEVTSEPVQTQFGFHVIKVEEVRPVAVPPLEQVSGQIAQQLLQQKYINLVKELREGMEIEILTGGDAAAQ